MVVGYGLWVMGCGLWGVGKKKENINPRNKAPAGLVSWSDAILHRYHPYGALFLRRKKARFGNRAFFVNGFDNQSSAVSKEIFLPIADG